MGAGLIAKVSLDSDQEPLLWLPSLVGAMQFHFCISQLSPLLAFVSTGTWSFKLALFSRFPSFAVISARGLRKIQPTSAFLLQENVLFLNTHDFFFEASTPLRRV